MVRREGDDPPDVVVPILRDPCDQVFDLAHQLVRADVRDHP